MCVGCARWGGNAGCRRVVVEGREDVLRGLVRRRDGQQQDDQSECTHDVPDRRDGVHDGQHARREEVDQRVDNQKRYKHTADIC